MSTKANGLESTEWARAPPTGPLWQRFLKTIYNPEEKSFLGRTAKRWGIVVTFYLVFYAVLALLFAACMGGLFLSIDPNRPTHTLRQSLIGDNPGLTSRPMASPAGAQIWYNRENTSYHEFYTSQLDEFLKPYQQESWFVHEGCTSNDSYGYPDSPCFIIKLNKIFGWEPQYYELTDLPADMPPDLVEHIHSLEDPAMLKKVWISCAAEGGNTTKIEYPWGRGLPARFYPFVNAEGYRSPLVAVTITPLANTLTIVRCRAWAKNIIYNKSLKDASGYTRIQLYIEDTTSKADGD